MTASQISSPPSAASAAAPPNPRHFQVALIKPSHYDDDGYVIQWFRSFVPSNSLAVVYSLVEDSRQRGALGDDIAIDITAADEINTRIKPGAIIERFRAHDNFGLVFLVGVQSNQFPRALDIARPLRQAGVPVAIGGFHVSGCLAMLPGIQPDLQEALDLGITLYAGELEGRCDALLRDAAGGTLQSLYNYLNELPSLEGAPSPILPKRFLQRTYNTQTSFDAGRGCPYQCSFCTIINVQGRKSRRRSPDDVERIIRENIAQNIRQFFITDDNFARNKDWEIILDRIIAIREGEKKKLRFVIQVDTLCHRIPNFIEKCGRAGVSSVFIGLENINPENLIAAKKRQNKITEYRQMLLAWKKQRIITYAGFILGFPNDTPETIIRDIEIIKRELPIDLLEFFCLTPLPGSEDHQKLAAKGVAMDPDMNKYDLEHVVTGHAKMTQVEWEGAYRLAWETFYTPDHIERVMRRAVACRISAGKILSLMLYFYGCITYERIHPLEGGLLRMKFRKDRRQGLPIEPAWAFYPKFVAHTVSKHWAMAKMILKYHRIRQQLRFDPEARSYTDTALTPVGAEEAEVRELLTHTEAARAATAHQRKVQGLTGKAAVAAAAGG
ncbi:MAG TPA: radical SAM protein [Rhodopseudomonas sp.]|uniref:B12-binding domain-containing radical SAM protein n=1 Tax=Rhodopseudomonas sp. TaxID=1078 RepID=UPI002ED7C633